MPTVVGDGGARTQDAEHWWTVICESVRRGVAAVDASRVVAVSVTGQWASTVPVDEAGHPVGPCVLWSDTRGAPYSRAAVGGPVSGYAPKALATWLRRSGGVPDTSGSDPVGHMLFLQHECPEVLARARWLLEPVDYLTMRFTGMPAATLASMTGAWLTDIRSLATLDYDDVLVRAAGVDGSLLPPLVATGSVLGRVLPEVATVLGIPATAVAVTGLPDLHAAVVGAGAVELGQPHASIGTTAWISAPVPRKKTDVLRRQASVPGLDNASYLLANNQDSAGRNLQWWRDTVAPDVSYEALLAEAAATPPGAGGVVFTPWLTGERSPIDDRRARAGFHGVGETDHPRRPDARRAGGRRTERELAARCRREVRRLAPRRHPPRRWGSPVGPVVPGAGRRHRPDHRARHRPVAGRASRFRLVRGAGARPGRAVRGSRAGAHRPAVPPRPAAPGDVRRPGARAAQAVRRPARLLPSPRGLFRSGPLRGRSRCRLPGRSRSSPGPRGRGTEGRGRRSRRTVATASRADLDHQKPGAELA